MKILLIVLDKESHINSFPLGIAYLASTVRTQTNAQISIWHQDVYHYPDQEILNVLEEGNFDIVGFGVCGYQQFRKGLNIAQYINQSKKRPLFVLGAHGPSGAPDFFLKKYNADIVIRGEGERIWENLIKNLEQGKDWQNLKGLSWRRDEVIQHNPDEALVEKLDLLPYPAWDLFPMDHYVLDKVNAATPLDRCFPVLASRGCPQRCNFCYRMYEGYRLRTVANVLEEIKELKERYRISYITFVDENLMSSTKRALSFCEGFEKAKLDVRWDCMGRLNVATPDVLSAMKKAGCTYINYGIESVDQTSLDLMEKDLQVKEIYSGIENTIAAGLYPGLNVIWGNIGDNAETLEKGKEFLIKYNTPLQIRTIKPVTPYPGTKLFQIALERGLLKDVEDFYSRYLNTDRMTVNFTKLSEEECYQLLFEANKAITKTFFEKSTQKAIEGFHRCYFEGDISFRGPRHS